MGLSNDERGWIMTSLSGIACVLGASIICIDIVVRLFPGKKNFRIQDSDTFLSASLSLSFGVMLFSALYSMLPSAKRSLQDGGFSPKQAAWTLIGCFLGGILGIQIISRALHHFIPSHIVDCEHSHDDNGDEVKPHGRVDEQQHDHAHDHDLDEEQAHVEQPANLQTARRSSVPGRMSRSSSALRPYSRTSYFGHTATTSLAPHDAAEANGDGKVQAFGSRRPSLQQRLSTSFSQFTSGRQKSCDCDGPCYGYTEPCGQDCFKKINARGGHRVPGMRMSNGTMRPSMQKSVTTTSNFPVGESTPLLQDIAEESRLSPPLAHHTNTQEGTEQGHRASDDSSATIDAADGEDDLNIHKTHSNETTSSHNPDHHHHHVPTNAFLSIGLQTSIAIALHKLPEGFITYATNHANPQLGFAVFLALFIHNITEGFAMALPLYLAINNRIKAMLISFVLGGLSQPLGAGVAALWFKIAGNGDWSPSEGVYGAMFAVTAGIMASVALQLFSEALDLTHSKTLCMVGAFCGMGVLGISSALTA